MGLRRLTPRKVRLKRSAWRRRPFRLSKRKPRRQPPPTELPRRLEPHGVEQPNRAKQPEVTQIVVTEMLRTTPPAARVPHAEMKSNNTTNQSQIWQGERNMRVEYLAFANLATGIALIVSATTAYAQSPGPGQYECFALPMSTDPNVDDLKLDYVSSSFFSTGSDDAIRQVTAEWNQYMRGYLPAGQTLDQVPGSCGTIAVVEGGVPGFRQVGDNIVRVNWTPTESR